MRRNAIWLSAGFLLLGASMAPLARGLEPSRCDPAAWQADIDAFAKQDADKPPPAGVPVLVGSSSIRLWDLAKSFPDISTINRGFGGSQICDSTHFADVLVAKYKPRVIVFYAGDNDIASGKSAEQVHVDFRAFVAKVRKSLPKTPIVFIAIKPSIDRWKFADVQREANRRIAADCDQDDTLEFIDVWPAMLGDDGFPRKELFVEDGLHMNEKGYAIWADLVRTFLAEPAQ